MGQVVRRNERRFYRYPMRRVAAVIGDEEHLQQALHDLQQEGVSLDAVDVLSGPEGVQLLDRTGARHGLRARLLRLLQRTAYEGETLDLHETALRQDHHVIYVAVSDADRERVVSVLRAAGGHHLMYYGRWSVEELRF